MRVEPKKVFNKAVRKLGADDIGHVLKAVGLFTANPKHPGLNFEPVTGKAGVYTIRATSSLRIFLKATSEADLYDLVDIGSHDLYR